LAGESERRKQRADELELKSQRMRAELNQAVSELKRIKSLMAWRCYQAFRPAVLAGRRVRQRCGDADVDGSRWRK
jgi:hypothetical protein